VLGIGRQDKNQTFAPAIADQDESFIERARQILPELGSSLHDVAAVISNIVTRVVSRTRQSVDDEIASFNPNGLGAKAARDVVKFFYDKFALFDVALFPLMYDTDVGTPELISVIRVSPDDATRLLNQADHPGSPKLAGVSLGHFGAFLDRSFRTNDVLWGRLDGAERLIRSLLPTDAHEGMANRLIDEAHGIVIEEFLEERQTELAGVLFEIAKSLGTPSNGSGMLHRLWGRVRKVGFGVQLSDSEVEKIRQSVAETLGSLPSQRVKDAFRGFLTKDKIREYLRSCPPTRQPDRRTTLESTTRAIGIVGGVLQSVGKESEAMGGFLVRLATALWWLVQAAVPNGLAGHFIRRVFALLFLFEIVMVLGGTFFNQAAQSLGLTLLAITIALWLIKNSFERFILRGKPGLKLTLVFTLVSALVASAIWFVRLKYGPIIPLEHSKELFHTLLTYVHDTLTCKAKRAQ
jgi:Protein of unknown function (DUF3376)